MNRGPSAAAPTSVYAAAPHHWLVCQTAGRDSLRQGLYLPRPTRTLKRRIAPRAGVQRPPTKESEAANPKVPSDFHARAAQLRTRGGGALRLPAGLKARTPVPGPQPKALPVAFTHAHPSPQVSQCSPERTRPRQPFASARSHPPQPTSPGHESNPASFCFGKQARFICTGVHVVPPKHEHPRAGTRPLPFS